jgi:hypothetical protein
MYVWLHAVAVLLVVLSTFCVATLVGGLCGGCDAVAVIWWL